LAALGFLLVIYGTFLTRSGVLADFSVHSFTDLGMNAYLVAFLSGFLVMILSLVMLRFGRIKPLKKTDDPWSADFLMALGMVVTTAFAVLILIGTSAPLITRLPIFPETANVDVGYYSRIALPIGIMIALLAGLTPFLKTGSPSVTDILRRSSPSLMAAALGTLLGLLLGVDSVGHSLVVFFAVFALAANAQILIASPRRLGVRIGGNLAHIGFGVILIGFLASGTFARSEKAILLQGTATDVMEYSITYIGMGPDISQKRNPIYLEIGSGDTQFSADPRLYQDKYSGGLMREPYIRSYLFHDLYIAPEKVETRQPGEAAMLHKGESGVIAGWDVTFHGFDMSSHGEPGSIRVGAIATAVSGDDTVSVVPKLAVLAEGGQEQTPAPLDSLGTLLILDDLDPATKTVQLRVSSEGDTARDILIIEVSTKPLIMLVWLGAILIVAGTFISSYRRFSTLGSMRQNSSDRRSDLGVRGAIREP
jgi:cytochrome c-type biogenesis protein CcmF